MACATSCKTQNHQSYGQCLRSQGLAVMGLESTPNSFAQPSVEPRTPDTSADCTPGTQS